MKVVTISYSFLKNVFECDSSATQIEFDDCSKLRRIPPFQIHEKTALVVNLKDVNPFIYSAGILALQGDQISNETLSEKNLNKELTVEFQPIRNISLDSRLGLETRVSNKTFVLTKSIDSLNSKASELPDLAVLMTEINEAENQKRDLLLKLQKRNEAIAKSKVSLDSANVVNTAIASVLKTTHTNTQAKVLSIKTTKVKRDRIKEIVDSLRQRKLDFQMRPDTVGDKIKRLQFPVRLNEIAVRLAEQEALLMQMLEKVERDTVELESLNEKLNQLKLDSVRQYANAEMFKLKWEAFKASIDERADRNEISNQDANIARNKNLADTWSTINTQLLAKQKALFALDDASKQEVDLFGCIVQIQKAAYHLNKLVQLHNGLITLVHLPENDWRVINAQIDNLFINTLSISRGELDKYLTTINDSINTLVLQSNFIINGLYGKQVGEERELAYNLVIEKLKAITKSIDEVNVAQLMRQIKFMLSMVSPQNFKLTPIRTFSFEENADFARFHIELKPNSLTSIPQGKSPEPLDFSIKLKGGIKYDVSSGFAIDMGLRDTSYYFDKTTDNNGDTVFVRKNENGGSFSPAIAAFLNGYWRSSSVLKIGGTFGLGINNGARIRLYLGPTLILGRKERVILTGGIAFGSVSRLTDGYEVGQALPYGPSLPNEVPTIIDKFALGYFFGVGFNLTGQNTRDFLQNIKFK